MWGFLLSTTGRTARLPYALFMVSASLALFAASHFLIPVFMNIGMSAYGGILMAITLIGLLLVRPFHALSVRRLKDINAPTWPALLFLSPLLTMLLFITVPFVVPALPESSTGVNPQYELVNTWLDYASGAFIWLNRVLILVLSLIPGTKGPNRYGPPPGQKAASVESVFE